MKSYEKQALIKFASIYFLSVAIFILLIGFLYYKQQENIILQQHTMKMHQYAMKLKQNGFDYNQEGYSYKILTSNHLPNKLATKEAKSYIKLFPIQKGEQFIQISLQEDFIDNELETIKNFTIVAQLILLVIFLLISYYLAKLSIKPMHDTISHLDRFIKDLIHDLNTPITAISLNVKMLEKKIDNEDLLKKLNRIKNSSEAIGSLYDNLEVILKEKLPKTKIDLQKILEEKLELCQQTHPNIDITLENKPMVVLTNEQAVSRIIDNLLQNACKYSKEKGKINISFEKSLLTINDNGKGMKYPEKVFERSYSENENGHGIGMHIVQRLCTNLDIKIYIESKENEGTIIKLSFY